MVEAPAALVFGAFTLDCRADGVAVATFSRPPVNAFSIAEYRALGDLIAHVEGDAAIRVLVLNAPDDARAWCGGADLRDFEGITKAARAERYAFINSVLPRFHALDRPTIAAINKAAIGLGMVLASLCDFRVAAASAAFAVPEINFGLLSGGPGRFAALRLPESKLREMLYTGARFSAADLEPTGFFNYVVDESEVLPRALALAEQLAAKDPAAMRARKRDTLELEGTAWLAAYERSQRASGDLVENEASRSGVRDALKSRSGSDRPPSG